MPSRPAAGLPGDRGNLMPPPTTEPARVTAPVLSAFIARAFRAAGLPEDDARTLGELIAEADLRGSDTHGVFRIPGYCRRIKGGGVKARPNIRIVAERT